jgi:uncharacterized membrane protein
MLAIGARSVARQRLGPPAARGDRWRTERTMSARRDILDWAEAGCIASSDVPTALRVGGALPAPTDWVRFVEQLLLWLGAVLIAAGVGFFVAYNWQDLGRFEKLALVQGLVVAALTVVGWKGLDGAAGKAALFGATLLVGALLALVGQIYQTGADTFELFAAWGLAILPWVLVARFAPLWVLWLAIANLAIVLYYTTFGGLLGVLFGPERLLWVLLALNTVALVLWESLAAAGIRWLGGRWAPRLLALASGGLVTALAIWHLLDWRGTSGWGVPLWLAWLVVAYLVYRRWRRDLFVLAGGVSSVVLVAATFLLEHMGLDDYGGFLLVALAVIGLSALGTRWLHAVAAETDE